MPIHAHEYLCRMEYGHMYVYICVHVHSVSACEHTHYNAFRDRSWDTLLLTCGSLTRSHFPTPQDPPLYLAGVCGGLRCACFLPQNGA